MPSIISLLCSLAVPIYEVSHYKDKSFCCKSKKKRLRFLSLPLSLFPLDYFLLILGLSLLINIEATVASVPAPNIPANHGLFKYNA